MSSERKSVFRNAAPRNFTTVPNAALRDSAISIEARGLLVFVLSYPQTWRFRIKWLCEEAGIGRDKARTIVLSLTSAGYCRRVPLRDNLGKIDGYEYLFTDTPGRFDEPGTNGDGPAPEKASLAKPAPEKPAPAEPAPVNPPPYKETIEVEKTYSQSARAREVTDLENGLKKEVQPAAPTPRAKGGPVHVTRETRMAIKFKPETIANAKALAPGWDIKALTDEFFDMNDGKDLHDVDRAFLGFAGFTGRHPENKAVHKLVGAYTDRKAVFTVKCESAQGRAWLEYLAAHERDDLEAEARANGTMRVPSLWPPKDQANEANH